MTGLPLSTRSLEETVAWVDGQPVSLSLLLGRAEQLAGQLPGFAHAINMCRGRHAFSVAFLATVMAGGTNLLPANRLPGTLSRLIRDHSRTIVITDEAVNGIEGTVVDAGKVMDMSPSSTTVPRLSADHLAAIVFTSGSTGSSSRILKPWKTLHDSSRINAAGYALSRQVHAAATVPAQHMWGLETTILLPWFAPQAVSCGLPFFAQDVIDQLARLPEPRVLISTPVHLRALIGSGLAWPKTELVLSSTAPLDAALASRIEAACGGRVVEIYGCSETGCLARRQSARQNRWEFLDGLNCHRRAGACWIEAEHLPEPVRLMDRLQIDPDGRFRLAGREKDLVNIAGKRASLAELTQVLLQIEGVVDGVIFQPVDDEAGGVTRLAALVVAPTLSAGDIRRQLAARVDAAFIPRPLRLVEKLPREESGKLSRTSLLQLHHQHCELAG
jgi:acyl-coenzyme A synthetase/AMP-(fatty) acid ligase